jgi:hypothetical protein
MFFSIFSKGYVCCNTVIATYAGTWAGELDIAYKFRLWAERITVAYTPRFSEMPTKSRLGTRHGGCAKASGQEWNLSLPRLRHTLPSLVTALIAAWKRCNLLGGPLALWSPAS